MSQGKAMTSALHDLAVLGDEQLASWCIRTHMPVTSGSPVLMAGMLPYPGGRSRV
jgi:hypothetical protein